MFHHPGVLPHSLRPAAYAAADVFAEEQQRLFSSAWHWVCPLRDLARAGDQVAVQIAGVPIVVRRDDDSIKGFVNVCAHRHCQIVRPGCSHAERLRCPYHGWEYGPDGRLARLPDGGSFAGLDARSIGLVPVRVDVVGPLVFANLETSAPPFLTSLGGLQDEFQRFFGHHRVVGVWSTEHDVNWKVIVENAVESYHVPLLHPSTFEDFRPPELHDHTLAEGFTRYLDEKPWETRPRDLAARFLTWALLPAPSYRRFTQAHVFPSLLLYYGELISTLIAVVPLTATRTRHVAVSLLPDSLRSPALRPLQALFGRLFARVGAGILREDMAAWPAIQRGLAASPFPGVLSCREERVHAFQEWVAKRVPSANVVDAAPLGTMAVSPRAVSPRAAAGLPILPGVRVAADVVRESTGANRSGLV